VWPDRLGSAAMIVTTMNDLPGHEIEEVLARSSG
jgi:hypothetical protein